MRRAAFLLSLIASSAVAQTAPPPLPPQTSPPVAQPPVPESYSPQARTATIPMRVDVQSPTTFIDVETRQLYRLYGVDSCDSRQTATLGRQTWPCGVVAMSWLVTATLNKWVACTTIRREDTAIVARCATAELPDIANEMLKVGYAITLPGTEDRLITTYPQTEKDARNAYRGLWGSSFQMPWIYRQQHPVQPTQPKAP